MHTRRGTGLEWASFAGPPVGRAVCAITARGPGPPEGESVPFQASPVAPASAARWCGCVLVVAALAAAAIAQPRALVDARYLHPSAWRVAQGETVGVQLLHRHAEQLWLADWPTDQVDWLFVRGTGAQRNLLDARPVDPRTLSVRIEQAGVSMIGLDLKPTVVDIAGDELARFVREQVSAGTVPSAVLDAAAQPVVRVRRVESMKLLVRTIGGASRPSPVALSKSGQRVEIRFAVDPTVAPINTDVPLRAYAGDSSAGGATVHAWHPASGTRQSVRLDDGGIGQFRLTHPGLWRVEVHVAGAGDGDADVTLYTATATFDALGRSTPP